MLVYHRVNRNWVKTILWWSMKGEPVRGPSQLKHHGIFEHQQDPTYGWYPAENNWYNILWYTIYLFRGSSMSNFDCPNSLFFILLVSRYLTWRKNAGRKDATWHILGSDADAQQCFHALPGSSLPKGTSTASPPGFTIFSHALITSSSS